MCCMAAPAVLWLLLASMILTSGLRLYDPGRSFYLLVWWDALGWWDVNWWCKAWIVIGAAVATIVLMLIGLIGVFAYRGRYAILGRNMVMWAPPARPWSRQPPAMTHGDAAFTAPDEAARRLRR